MNEDAVVKGTGQSLAEWFLIIRKAGKTDAPHKQIADFLHETHDVSYWWAQEITVEYEKGSHVRMRWQHPDWSSHSILQIRVTPKSASKTTLSFHQEKLPTLNAREEMRERWRRAAEEIANAAVRSD